MDIASKLRTVRDFPKPGVNFIDITTLLQEPEAFQEAINKMSEFLPQFGECDIIVSPESRGFIFGVPIAYNIGKGFVPVRKKGKLPYTTVQEKYALEYGYDTVEMHTDAIKKGQRVIIIDDILATGGTITSCIKLVERLGGIVAGLLFFAEIEFLNGKENLHDYKIQSLLKL